MFSKYFWVLFQHLGQQYSLKISATGGRFRHFFIPSSSLSVKGVEVSRNVPTMMLDSAQGCTLLTLAAKHRTGSNKKTVWINVHVFISVIMHVYILIKGSKAARPHIQIFLSLSVSIRLKSMGFFFLTDIGFRARMVLF